MRPVLRSLPESSIDIKEEINDTNANPAAVFAKMSRDVMLLTQISD